PAATAAGFTMVIEPGEVDRDEADVGIPPPAARSVNGVPVRRVGPVLLHDHHDLCDRARALADLDLPADGRYGLISLGTGLAGPLAHTAGPLVTALRNRGLVPVVAASPLSPPPTVEGALVRQRYPLAPSLAAFDVVVLAAGYNSVVEAVACRAPAVLVPNPAAAVDDQLARAVALDQQGLAVLWDSTGRAGAEGAAGPGPAGALDRALDGRAELVERMAARAVPQGATRAAALVQELAQSRAHQPRRRSIR
ncbi:MAG: glycosyltransferase, partial [Actinomycetota bacterium]